jgi:hypothetical protein
LGLDPAKVTSAFFPAVQPPSPVRTAARTHLVPVLAKFSVAPACISIPVRAATASTSASKTCAVTPAGIWTFPVFPLHVHPSAKTGRQAAKTAQLHRSGFILDALPAMILSFRIA